MRSIHFRARLKQGGWFYWSVTDLIDDVREDVLWETVGQNTGLEDKNGKAIFEGDLIGEKGCAYKVEFKDGIFSIGGGTEPAIYWIWGRQRKGLGTEIIDNIWENPDLQK